MRKAIFKAFVLLLVLEPALTSAASTNYRYTGQELDQTGLYDYGQRQYQPTVGKFIQPDPIQFNLNNPQKLREQAQKSQQEFLANPQNLNSYSYTANNPVNYTDPEGEFNFKTGAVEQGDTLSKVFGEQWREVAEYNNLQNPNLIYAGQILKLPPGFKKDQNLVEQGLDWGTSLTPGASDLRDFKEFIYGQDLFSGEKMNFLERAQVLGVALVPFISRSVIKKAGQAGEKLSKVLDKKLLANKTVRKILKAAGLKPEQVLDKISLPRQLNKWSAHFNRWLGGFLGKN